MSTHLEEIKEDGPTLLKFVLHGTFTATQASIFAICKGFYYLHLKCYRWNIVSMTNQYVHEKMADMTAASHSSNQTNRIISLFCAYNTATNEDFKSAIMYWKNAVHWFFHDTFSNNIVCPGESWSNHTYVQTVLLCTQWILAMVGVGSLLIWRFLRHSHHLVSSWPFEWSMCQSQLYQYVVHKEERKAKSLNPYKWL